MNASPAWPRASRTMSPPAASTKRSSSASGAATIWARLSSDPHVTDAIKAFARGRYDRRHRGRYRIAPFIVRRSAASAERAGPWPADQHPRTLVPYIAAAGERRQSRPSIRCARSRHSACRPGCAGLPLRASAARVPTAPRSRCSQRRRPPSSQHSTRRASMWCRSVPLRGPRFGSTPRSVSSRKARPTCRAGPRSSTA
ncbi:unnamed protein product [Acanthosepion pharaonis]|uniref:Uncharacterized protein n=1 Tax=Acanthosepion pharaonis TaxID=158019 RepID=A0A812DBB1_ACAPH|nr:unnamed protein product [Sepia pharaonis]